MSHLFFSVLSGTIVSGNQFSLCLAMKLFLKRLFKGLLDYWRICFYKIISSYYQNSIYIYLQIQNHNTIKSSFCDKGEGRF